MIILTGENGDMSLPFDPNAVKVIDADKNPGELSDLSVGINVNLNIEPGKSATIYLQK
jgi:hypothetical protein